MRALAVRSHAGTLAVGLGAAVLVTAALGLISIAVGARPIPIDVVWSALVSRQLDVAEHSIIWDLRLPRTLLGLMVGAALGLSGAMLQGATRNPLADPGILGIHAGAALFVVVGIAGFGLSTLSAYVWLAFAGAGTAMLLVYSVASLGREGATPVKLALAGAAVSAAAVSVINAILITRVDALNELRFWEVGSMASRDMSIVVQVAPFLIVGVIAALFTGRLLDGMAMGEDVARSLGQNVGNNRLIVGGIAVLLAGAATAACGPIAFVGLTVPHVARAFCGPNYRWVLPYSAVLAPILLLGSDIIGRVIAPPGEVQVGIVTAAIGAPFFMALVRRRKLAEL